MSVATSIPFADLADLDEDIIETYADVLMKQREDNGGKH